MALVIARIDAEVRDRASAVLENMGLAVSDAVRILLTRTANEVALPLELLSGSEARDAWFRNKVLEALSDTRPDVPDEEVGGTFCGASGGNSSQSGRAQIVKLTWSAFAFVQGIPVIDQTAILKHIESIIQLKSQLDALNQQITQAEQLFGSLNKLTNMADVASLLNQPEIRKALPQNFAAIENLLRSNSSGVFGEAASKLLESNWTYQTSVNDFYAQELSRMQNRNAGQMLSDGKSLTSRQYATLPNRKPSEWMSPWI